MRWLKELLSSALKQRGEPRLSEAAAPTVQGAPPAQASPQLAVKLPTPLHILEQEIGYKIRNPDLFVQALVHRSYLQQTHQIGQSNERLEFLGDSILNLVVGEYLYHHFPHADEGELTKVRSRLVNRKALVAYSTDLQLSRFILMSHSAQQSMGKGSETIVADTFEALIAAIYLDGGFEAAKQFVQRQLAKALNRRTVVTSDENYKSMLLEYAQAHGLGVPRYNIIREEGPDHDRTFTVEVIVGGKRRGIGVGKNKKEAEQAAAGRALEKLQQRGSR
ncbi:MAG TPA: ribonuclease III [Bacteroidota bacterium]|nr:ribonuclease III [Bacteroidota bacterium]